MKKILFLIFGSCVNIWGAEGILFSSIENGLYITFSFVLIILLILFSYFSIRNKFIYGKNTKKTKDVYFGQKIDVFRNQNREQDGNIVQRLSFYFFVIHKRAAIKNNKIVFNYTFSQNIIFKADFDQICYITHSILNFLLDICENTTITLQIRPLEKYENATTCRFYFNINNPLLDHKTNIEKALNDQSINYTYDKLKHISNLVKNIDIELSQNEYRNIIFKTNKQRSSLHFDIMLKTSYKEDTYKAREKFSGMNLKAVILDSDFNSYKILNHQLRLFGVSTLNRIDTKTAIEHIFDNLYIPNFLFVNIQNITNTKSIDDEMIKLSVKDIFDQMKLKKFILIVMLNNENEEENYKIFSTEKDCFMVRQPYNPMKIHEIIMNYVIKNNIKSQEISSSYYTIGGGI
nr:hypothetical protein [Campylobacter sp.]